MTTKTKARIAGLLYLAVVLTGIFSLMYVPKQLIVWDDAALTFTNIVASQTLFRFGIVSGIACYTFFLFLPLALYKLLSLVNETHARVMVILALVSVPISFVNIQNKLTVLSLTGADRYLSGFTVDQLQSQVLFYLNQYENGIMAVQVFWGLWLFPLGYLIFKSGFLPKFLGVLLMLGCFSYLINFLGSALISNYSEIGVASYIQLPASVGEIGTCLWLLIIGAKDRKVSG